MSENDEILQEVRSWLSRNGYVLEMEVAQALLPYCSMVMQGRRYVDPVTEKLRETDIFCTWTNSEGYTHHVVEMVVECKSTAAPWIAFFGGSEGMNGGRFPSQNVEKPLGCQQCKRLSAFYKISPGKGSPVAYSITEKKNEKGDKDLARDAVLAVTSAAVGLLREVENDLSRGGGVHYSYLILPVVVTRSPIVACTLGADGEVKLSRVKSCWISAFHETRDADRPILGLVINSEAFNDFVTEFAGICKHGGFE